MRAAPGGVLSLDLATVTGWAYSPLDASLPLFGTWQLARTDIGARAASLQNNLFDFHKLMRPSLIIYEAPMRVQAMNGAAAAEQQIGLTVTLKNQCWRDDVPHKAYSAYDVRRTMLGTGRFREGEVKPAVLAHCRKLGMEIDSHDAADACLLWLYYQRLKGE